MSWTVPQPRRCKFCKEVKVAVAFAVVEKDNATRVCRKRVCNDCFPAFLRDQATEFWADYIFHKYGITPASFQALGERQGWRCAVCRTDKPPRPAKKSRVPWSAWHIDHDHETNEVRGLLCINCNMLLGQAKDKLTVLDAAQRYLLCSKRTVAYCGGTFDLPHVGHARFFEWVKNRFGYVVVSLNSSEFVARYKGKAPVMTFGERKEVIEALRCVDAVVLNTGDEDSKPAILSVGATHIVNGSDWDQQRLMQQMCLTEEFLKQKNLTIALCPLARQFSTTELKERIRRP